MKEGSTGIATLRKDTIMQVIYEFGDTLHERKQVKSL
jgi:hypothetical protein